MLPAPRPEAYDVRIPIRRSLSRAPGPTSENDRAPTGSIVGGLEDGGGAMPWYLMALSMPVKIDVQRDPAPAILLVLALGGVLWLLVTFARHHDERRKARGDLSGWRSRERPRS